MKKSNPYKPLTDSEQITAALKILRLLERFTKHYTPLSVKIPGHNEHYTSCIVAVDEKHILLDELLPPTGHNFLVDAGALLLTGKLDGVDIQFFTTLEQVSNTDKMLTYHLKHPEILEYRQRRENFRVHIPMSIELPVIIENKDGKMTSGKLHNLSYGGAGILFLADKNLMDAGAHQECAIELPDSTWVYCTAELRHSKDIPSRDTQLVGVQFIDISPVQSRLIGHCINQIEREALRKRAAD